MFSFNHTREREEHPNNHPHTNQRGWHEADDSQFEWKTQCILINAAVSEQCLQSIALNLLQVSSTIRGSSNHQIQFSVPSLRTLISRPFKILIRFLSFLNYLHYDEKKSEKVEFNLRTKLVLFSYQSLKERMFNLTMQENLVYHCLLSNALH